MREFASMFSRHSSKPAERLAMRTTILSVHTLLPVFVGGVIYLLWRPDNLMLFSWLDALGISKLVRDLRSAVYSVRMHLPVWIIFSVPAGLWMYSLVAGLRLTWRGGRPQLQRLWLTLAALLGPGSELAQRLGILPGRFDLADLTAYVAAFVAAIYLVPTREKINGLA
jgi:hypothetical protein